MVGSGASNQSRGAGRGATIGNSSECRRDGQLRMAYGGNRHDMFGFPGGGAARSAAGAAARELTQGLRPDGWTRGLPGSQASTRGCDLKWSF